MRRGEGEDEGGAASRKKKKKTDEREGARPARRDSGSSRVVGSVSAVAPLALQCCRTNRRIARNNPPDARVLRAPPAALARSDRRAAIAAASRARAVAPADRRAPRSRRTRPSRRGDKRARGRGGAIGAGPRAVAIGRDDVEGGAVGGAGGGDREGGGRGGGGPAAGNRTVAARTSARPPRSALPGPRFPRARVRVRGARAEWAHRRRFRTRRRDSNGAINGVEQISPDGADRSRSRSG